MANIVVSSGVTSSNLTVAAGDTLVVSSGGIISTTTLTNGAEADILAGGSANLTTISGGAIDRVSGGIATHDIVLNGGFEFVSAGGSATATIVSSGGFEIVGSGGHVSGATVLSGGTNDINASGTDSGTVISSGGAENVTGGTVTDLTVIGTSGVLYSGGVLNISSGGAAIDTHLVSGGAMYVVSGGTTTGTLVDGFPSSETIGDGGFATGTHVESGGFQFVSGGSAVGTVINNAGTGFVFDGGTASGIVINSGGIDFVFKTYVSAVTASRGGIESGTIVNSGGIHKVDLGGISYSAVVSGGGTEFVDLSLSGVPAGIASATTVLSGGFQIVSAGTTFDTIVDGGAIQLVSSGSAVSGSVIEGGGYQVLSATNVASGIVLALGGAVDFAYLGFASGASATLGAGDVLSVTAGANTTTLQLAGDYTGVTFEVTSGLSTYGGTLVTAACYCEGTLIATDRGEAPIETLAIGDLVRTCSGALRPIHWIGRRSYAGPFVTDVVRPVLIRAGAIADGVPRRDLKVSPAHCMLIDGTLIPAAALVNGASITRVETVDEVRYVHIELDSHDTILAEGAASETFVDDGSRGMFQNAADYRVLYPHAVPVPARFCAPRAEAGGAVEAARLRLARRAGVEPAAVEPGALRGCLDAATRDLVAGWAQNQNETDRPVLLEVLDNGQVLGTVLANSWREDLERAGIGQGRHGFEFTVPGGLSPAGRHVITVRRAADGAELAGGPKQIEASDRFDADLERAVSRAVDAVAGPEAQERVLSFLLAQTDRLLQARAEADAQRTARHLHAQFRRRWGDDATAGEAAPADPGQRALVICEHVPSDAADPLFGHLDRLRGQGIAADVAAASMTAPDAARAALVAAGARFCGAPLYASVEDVLRRQGDCVDLIHLHGAGIKAGYLALARRHAPRARVVWSPDTPPRDQLAG